MKDLCTILGGLGCNDGKSQGQEAPPILAFCDEEDERMWVEEQGLDNVFLDVDAFPWGYGLECECDEDLDHEGLGDYDFREEIINGSFVSAPMLSKSIPARFLVITPHGSFFSSNRPEDTDNYLVSETADGLMIFEFIGGGISQIHMICNPRLRRNYVLKKYEDRRYIAECDGSVRRLGFSIKREKSKKTYGFRGRMPCNLKFDQHRWDAFAFNFVR